MSKFFNETLKARSETLPSEDLAALLGEKPPATETAGQSPEGSSVLVETVGEAPTLPEAAVNEREVSPVESSKMQLPIAHVLLAQFQGSRSLESAEEAYRGLRTRLMRIRVAQRIRSVVVTSALQGEGKTLTSMNLAASCARLQDMKLLLVDADIRTSGLSRALKLPFAPGLSEVLSGECAPEAAISATDIPNLYVMSSGLLNKPPAELFASQRWKELMDWSKEEFELTLVDAPPVLNLADVELILAPCDGALMVVRALYTKRDTLQKCAAQLDSKKICGVVYNGTAYSKYHRYYYGKKK